jgi:hypothetical protein
MDLNEGKVPQNHGTRVHREIQVKSISGLAAVAHSRSDRRKF